jgi:hypothetical protein
VAAVKAKKLRLCAECQCKECQARREVRKALHTVERPKGWVPEEGEWTLVAGVTRMGKSTWLKEVEAFLMAQGICVIKWDPQREGSRHGIKRENTPLGPLQTQLTVSELEEDDDEHELLLSIEGDAKEPAIAIVCDEERPTREEVADGFVRAMRHVLRYAPGGLVVLVIEEIGLLEGNEAAEKMIEEITFSAGKDGFCGFLASQSTGMVPVRARSNCRKVVSFKQLDDNDLVALTRLVAPKFSRIVGRLERHQCVMADRMERHLWRDDAPEEAGAEDAA